MEFSTNHSAQEIQQVAKWPWKNFQFKFSTFDYLSSKFGLASFIEALYKEFQSSVCWWETKERNPNEMNVQTHSLPHLLLGVFLDSPRLTYGNWCFGHIFCIGNVVSSHPLIEVTASNIQRRLIRRQRNKWTKKLTQYLNSTSKQILLRLWNEHQSFFLIFQSL